MVRKILSVVIPRFPDGTPNSEKGNILKSVTNSEVSFKDGIMYEKNKLVPFTGVVLYPFKTGQTEVSIVYKKGIADGMYVEYHINGNIKINGFYKNGKKSELWKEYYRNGLLEKETEYKNNLKEGSEKLYRPRVVFFVLLHQLAFLVNKIKGYQTLISLFYLI